MPAWLFDPDALAERGVLTGTSPGRRSAWYFRHADRSMVLRHYWRGGMVARISPDVYLWAGLRRARPVREWQLLQAMRDHELPVPRPVAARVDRRTLCYRGDLVTLTIPRAQTFDSVICQGLDDAALWKAVGETIRRFHAAGFHHADLNVRNILVDQGGTVWLIDWDRGSRQAPGRWWRSNLKRLRRSLDKQPLLAERAGRHWDDLRLAYDAAPGRRR